MDDLAFINAYHDSRNGTDGWTRHPLARTLVYSDGVKELAETGCYWLLDVIGTEFVPAAKRCAAELDGMGFIYVNVKDTSATITLRRDGGEPPLYTRHVEYTDMPEGEWLFYFGEDQPHWNLYLPTEY